MYKIFRLPGHTYQYQSEPVKGSFNRLSFCNHHFERYNIPLLFYELPFFSSLYYLWTNQNKLIITKHGPALNTSNFLTIYFLNSGILDSFSLTSKDWGLFLLGLNVEERKRLNHPTHVLRYGIDPVAGEL